MKKLFKKIRGKFHQDILDELKVINHRLDNLTNPESLFYKEEVSKNQLAKIENKPLLYDGVKFLGLDRLPVCKAPLETLNFDTSGRITNCCMNRTYDMGKWPQVSIGDAWFGIKRKRLLAAVNNYDFNLGCWGCYDQIITKNNNVFAKNFDGYYVENDGWPIMFEFECSNICNFECIMCGGKWSSSIRNHREKMPPLEIPYNDTFVEQLDEFIPHLKVAKFLGGEPFLSPLYYKIWHKIALLNNNLHIEVTSNCSIYNSKVQEVFDSLPNLYINLSLDSLQKDTYETIRRNGDFGKVMKNVKHLLKIGRLRWLAFCPMIQNVYEIPNIVKFCEYNNIDLGINTVTNPLGGLVKGIHTGGQQTTIFNGELREKLIVDIEKERHNELLPEFRLECLPKGELIKIKTMLEETEAQCTASFKYKIAGIRAQVVSFLAE